MRFAADLEIHFYNIDVTFISVGSSQSDVTLILESSVTFISVGSTEY